MVDTTGTAGKLFVQGFREGFIGNDVPSVVLGVSYEKGQLMATFELSLEEAANLAELLTEQVAFAQEEKN